MKKVASLLLVLATLLGLSVTALAADPTATAYEAAKTYFANADRKNMLPIEEVVEIAEKGEALLLDIRGAEDYAAAHLKGAVNIPFLNVVEYLDQLPMDRMIVVNCYSGQTAGQIVGSLRMAGFNAYSLSGGWGSVTETTPVETTVNEFVPAENAERTETQQALLEAARKAMTIPEGKNVIQPADLHAELTAEPGKYFVLDVRDKEAYDKGHIEGAVNVPYYEVGGYIDNLPKDKTIAVVCNSGQQSSQTVAVLLNAGFKALNVQSGMNKGWNPAGLPTVATVVETPVETPVEPTPDETPVAPVEPAPAADTYTVKAGDSLWKIAQNLLGSGARWNELYKANTAVIKNPDMIYVGQVLTVPAK